MKVRASVKPICEKCKVVRRRGTLAGGRRGKRGTTKTVLRIICENRRHLQRQG